MSGGTYGSAYLVSEFLSNCSKLMDTSVCIQHIYTTQLQVKNKFCGLVFRRAFVRVKSGLECSWTHVYILLRVSMVVEMCNIIFGRQVWTDYSRIDIRIQGQCSTQI